MEGDARVRRRLWRLNSQMRPNGSPMMSPATRPKSRKQMHTQAQNPKVVIVLNKVRQRQFARQPTCKAGIDGLPFARTSRNNSPDPPEQRWQAENRDDSNKIEKRKIWNHCLSSSSSPQIHHLLVFRHGRVPALGGAEPLARASDDSTSPCVTNTCCGAVVKCASQPSRAWWSACPEKP